MIQSSGGKIEIIRLFRLVYFADLRHLTKYGSLITGDTYIAMKSGPMPFHVFLLYQKLLTNDHRIAFEHNVSEYFSIEDSYMNNLQEYDGSYMSKSEVECIFSTIREYKNSPIVTILNHAMNSAWINTGLLYEISLENMAQTGQVSNSMISYIQHSNKVRSHYNINSSSRQAKDNIDPILYSMNIGRVLKDNSIEDEQHQYIIVGISVKHCALVEIINGNNISLEHFDKDLTPSFIQFTSSYDFILPASYIDCSKLFIISHDKLSARLKNNPDTILGILAPEDIHSIINTVLDSYTIAARAKEEFLPA